MMRPLPFLDNNALSSRLSPIFRVRRALPRSPQRPSILCPDRARAASTKCARTPNIACLSSTHPPAKRVAHPARMIESDDPYADSPIRDAGGSSPPLAQAAPHPGSDPPFQRREPDPTRLGAPAAPRLLSCPCRFRAQLQTDMDARCAWRHARRHRCSCCCCCHTTRPYRVRFFRLLAHGLGPGIATRAVVRSRACLVLPEVRPDAFLPAAPVPRRKPVVSDT